MQRVRRRPRSNPVEPPRVATAAWLRERAQAGGDRFAACLPGGSTPRRVYELLASTERARFPWDRVHWFFGDERFVPHDHPDSNYRMVRAAMLDTAPVPAANVHPIPTAGAPAQAAGTTRASCTISTVPPPLIRSARCSMWCCLAWARTATPPRCFPARRRSMERERWVVDVLNPKAEPRITLTYPALDQRPRLGVPGGGRQQARHPGARLGRRGFAGGTPARPRGAGLVY